MHLTTFVNILPKLRYFEGRNYIQTGFKSYSFSTFVFLIDLWKVGTSLISRKGGILEKGVWPPLATMREMLLLKSCLLCFHKITLKNIYLHLWKHSGKIIYPWYYRSSLDSSRWCCATAIFSKFDQTRRVKMGIKMNVRGGITSICRWRGIFLRTNFKDYLSKVISMFAILIFVLYCWWHFVVR